MAEIQGPEIRYETNWSPDCDNGYCYFMRAGDNGPIKIGWTMNVRRRRQQLQAGCPWKLNVLTTIQGNPNVESSYHEMFQDHWIRGDWFEADKSILDFIDHLEALRREGNTNG